MSDSEFDTWGRTLALGKPVENVGDLFERTQVGSRSSAITNTFLGFNHRGLPSSIPLNRDYYGMVFFTKPDMNMQTKNIQHSDIFTPLLTSEEMSLPRAIRCMLDARHKDDGGNGTTSFSCPGLVDPKQAFLPLLTNLAVSMGGWPDIELPTFTTEKGVYGEELSFVDGIGAVYRTYDITVNFRNILGDPITGLFYYWLMYAQNVFEGTLVPHTENLIQHAIDYVTRIYRFILDPGMRYIQKSACTGASFPDRLNIGAAFSYESNAMFNSTNNQIGINFRCIGADYFNDMIIHDFNRSAMLSNSDLGNVNETDSPYVADEVRSANNMMKVPVEYLHLFNHNGYPLINIYTHELEWWVYKHDYTELTGETDGGADAVFNLDNVD